eukprot:640944-Alexandrium_andersonii.AAC.1
MQRPRQECDGQMKHTPMQLICTDSHTETQLRLIDHHEVAKPNPGARCGLPAAADAHQHTRAY